ncbi:MAG: hypothetical protein MR646_08150 [Agathobacter sp.]|nr:hypothetical protein [Agathobacter sp.]
MQTPTPLSEYHALGINSPFSISHALPVKSSLGRSYFFHKKLSIFLIVTDKCNLYSVIPVYEGDPEYEKAWKAEANGDGEKYEMIAYVDSKIPHHYKLNTGKIFVPSDENGTLRWDNLTRFVTSDEECYTYGYLMKANPKATLKMLGSV